MDEWIDYYDSAPAIYVSKAHRDAHYRTIAGDIAGYIPFPQAVVLDYSCGEAMSAPLVASRCGRLILAEPAPGVRGRLAARLAAHAGITVLATDDLNALPDASIDLAVMISVAQYMRCDELDAALALIWRLLKPGGRLVLGDILRPEIGAATDVMALLRFAARHGFLKDALTGLVRTALSDYWQLRQSIGLQRYSEAAMIEKLGAAGFHAARAPNNVGHNAARMTFLADK